MIVACSLRVRSINATSMSINLEEHKMKRIDMINKIGREYHVSNLENDEFSFPKALKAIGKTIDAGKVTSKGTTHSYVDMRFVSGNVTILIETKNNFDNWNSDSTISQLQAYVSYEKELTGNKIIAILANTTDDRLKVWWGSDLTIDEAHQLTNQSGLKSFHEYEELYTNTHNNREMVIKSTYALNETLHKYGISEKIRSQFVGTCLLALKKDLIFEKLSTKQILGGIEEIIKSLLGDDMNKILKLAILKNKVIDSQDVSNLKSTELQDILRTITVNILPYINDRNTQGQDILNLFFTTFNKYVGKADKNQAFSPDHMAHFMCQVVGINRNSRVLDPCSGSGVFMVRAMTEALDDCTNEQEQDAVRKEQIYGIEFEEAAFGLSTTNMLIHGDGNSNVRQGSCFDLKKFIEDAKINVVLMNPPYNAQRKYCDPDFVKRWNEKTKEDPSQGFHYVQWVASVVKTGKLAVLLPMQCAIGSSNEIKAFKEKMLQEHTLDAVFSLPSDLFHPGANVSSCCMVFNLGTRHARAGRDTFFGYFKDDGFTKKKNLGRVEKTKPDSAEGVWADIESSWLDCYRRKISIPGLSVVRKVSAEDEWLAEAHMKTDYSSLVKVDFEREVKRFAQYKLMLNLSAEFDRTDEKLTVENWRPYRLSDLFDIRSTKGGTTDELIPGLDVPYIAAKKEGNGCSMMCSRAENADIISTGNCIVFIQLGAGSAGYATYQESDFIGMYGKTSCGYNKNLNKFNALFIVTLLDLERPKFSYGRSWTGDRLNETLINLPSKVTCIENGLYEPDWQYMENYIKELPSCDLI